MAHTKLLPVFIVLLILVIGCDHSKTKHVKQNDAASSTVITNTVNIDSTALDATLFGDSYTNSITQTFIAKQKKVTVLTGRHGLKVRVNPADLETIDGRSVTGDVVVKMVELTTTDDLFKSNAATTCNGKLLMSGGSYYVGMESNGQQLKLKANQSIQMELPKIKEAEMELFYGNRNANGDMNWTPAEQPLVIKQRYIDYNPPYPGGYKAPRFRSRYRMFDSLTAKVYFMNRLMTIQDMVDTLQKKGVDKNIDSILIPWESFFGRIHFEYDDSSYKRFVKKYRILSCKQIEAEKDSVEKENKVWQQMMEANTKYNEEWYRQRNENSLEAQIQAYYAPTEVKSLGWINCDRFYQDQQQLDVPVEIPYTFNNPSVQYFLIYKKFNGLMSGRLVKNKNQQYVLQRLPTGQSVTLVAFTKNNGQVFQCKEEFVIKAGETLKPEFTTISVDKMKTIFGANVKI